MDAPQCRRKPHSPLRTHHRHHRVRADRPHATPIVSPRPESCGLRLVASVRILPIPIPIGAALAPVTEDEPRTAYGDYGTGKVAIETLLHRETLAGGVPSVVLHPGHISGPGWPVITPAGNLDPDVWRRLGTGEPLALPVNGLGGLHHVHADDLA